jgi:hypothetical protein
MCCEQEHSALSYIELNATMCYQEKRLPLKRIATQTLPKELLPKLSFDDMYKD